jgi:hypothetical protein
VPNKARKWLETTWKPSKCIQQAILSSNFSPLLAMHNQAKNAKLLTKSFSNRQNSTKNATHVQMSKLDTL